MARITIGEIDNELEEIGWKCLTREYKNLDTLMVFQCEEGHKVHSTWKKIRSRAICPICQNNKNKQIVNIKAIPKKKDVYRVLAVDQSSRKNGYAIYDDKELIAYGVYESTSTSPLERMVDISDWLSSMIAEWKPDLVGFEETQYNPKQRMGHDVFKLLSQVMGAVMLTAARSNVIVKTVLIPTWRGHCKIKGRSRVDQKRSAQLIVKELYDISVTDDESDAICIGKYFSDIHREKDKIIIGSLD